MGDSSISSWTKYAAKHRWLRITRFPESVVPPKRVRIYSRSGHYMLQWWEPRTGRNTAERVNGDLISAIVRSRDIDSRLETFKTSGRCHTRCTHQELVTLFLSDMQLRADAEQIKPGTVDRYQSALKHYQMFWEQSENRRRHALAFSVDRTFALAFAGYLNSISVSPNGHASTPRRPIRGKSFILDAVRALYEWAADPDRGNLGPEGFRNPFRRSKRNIPISDRNSSGEPDISAGMAQEFLAACDNYQLRLFVPIVFYGLRAAEPCWLFHEFIDGDWLGVPCIPELNFTTKGKRNKRLPLLPEIGHLLQPGSSSRTGLLFTRRDFASTASLSSLTADFQARCVEQTPLTAAKKHAIRSDIMKSAGALTYDLIDAEFRGIAKRLNWPKQATLKDFRHLFATSMANAGMPDAYRRYLMGHAPDKAPIEIYTHLNKLRDHYLSAVDREMSPLLSVLRGRRLGDGPVVRNEVPEQTTALNAPE